MDAMALRAALAAFLGDAQYRKFVRQGSPGGRLRYWQQEAWDHFLLAHPECTATAGELEIALRVCEMHGEELCPDTAELFHGNLDYADWYIQARNQLFPHAAADVISTEGAPATVDRVVVWYCPACRVARAAWQSKRG